MCNLIRASKGEKYIYLEIEYNDWFFARKITFEAFDLGMKANNYDFIMMASKEIDDKDWTDSWNAVEFDINQY